MNNNTDNTDLPRVADDRQRLWQPSEAEILVRYGYGCGITLKGPALSLVACKAEMVSQLTQECRLDHATECQGFSIIPGSHLASISDMEGGGLHATYMLSPWAFRDAQHLAAICALAQRWPSLTTYFYGDDWTIENGGDGCRALFIGGQMNIRDKFQVDG